jgi:transcriptional regulator with XRE-family HTH domain
MSDITVNARNMDSRDDREISIRKRLTESVDELSIAQVGRKTGYNNETVRRYIHGKSRITADFLGQVCTSYQLDANYILTGMCRVSATDSLREVSTELLINELARRYQLVEDNTVGRAITKNR